MVLMLLFVYVCVCICVLLVFFFQMTKSVTNPEELGGLASQMTTDYGHLALQGQMAAATAEPEEVCHLKAPILRSKHMVPIPGGWGGERGGPHSLVLQNSSPTARSTFHAPLLCN